MVCVVFVCWCFAFGLVRVGKSVVCFTFLHSDGFVVVMWPKDRNIVCAC